MKFVDQVQFVNDNEIIDPQMVDQFSKAENRGFSVKQMLEKNPFIYNVRPPRKEVVERLMKEAGACSNVNASVKLKQKTLPAIRRELRNEEFGRVVGSKEKGKSICKDMYV